MKEIWKPIKGYEGQYEVSTMGRVRSIPREIPYSAGYTRKNEGRILKPTERTKDPDCNYYVVSLSKDNVAKSVFIHRLVAEQFIERKPGYDFVNHIDGNKHNNCVENLEWVTPKGNKMHAIYTGLDVPHYGIRHIYCLTNGEVYPSISEAARKLNLDDSSISKVCRGRWKHTGGMVFRYV